MVVEWPKPDRARRLRRRRLPASLLYIAMIVAGLGGALLLASLA